MKHNKLFLAGIALVVTAALVLGACNKSGGGNAESGGSREVASGEGRAAKASGEAAASGSGVKKAGLSNFGQFPADYRIAHLNMAGRAYTVRELFGQSPEIPFAAEFQGKPCTVTIESPASSASAFSATLLLTVEGVKFLRVLVEFETDPMTEMSYVRHVKGANMISGQTNENYDEAQAAGMFLGFMREFWDLDVPARAAKAARIKNAMADLQGTWVRTGADSGRDFDTTLVVTPDEMQWKYSDGREILYRITDVEPAANDPNNRFNEAANKAADFPAGWAVSVEIVKDTATPNNVGKTFRIPYYLNAAKNKLTQGGSDDLKDIWVKQ